jgi:hypothetical protein
MLCGQSTIFGILRSKIRFDGYIVFWQVFSLPSILSLTANQMREKINNKILCNMLILRKLWEFTAYIIKNGFEYFFNETIRVRK